MCEGVWQMRDVWVQCISYVYKMNQPPVVVLMVVFNLYVTFQTKFSFVSHCISVLLDCLNSNTLIQKKFKEEVAICSLQTQRLKASRGS